MNRLVLGRPWLVALVAAVAFGLPLFARQGRAAQPKRPYRNLAPGVLQSVEPARQVEESYSGRPHDVTELLEAERADAKFDWARNVAFRHDVWTLEFKFKPVRMIWVDIPQPGGHMRKKLIWYLLYRITNRDVEQQVIDVAALRDEDAAALPQYGWMRPVRSDQGAYKLQFFSDPIRFVPQFLLEGHESVREGAGFNKVYPDRVIPLAIEAIRAREDPKRRLFSSVEISRGRIDVGKTAWGVATWEDVDPRIDRFSIYVKGLTNAYRWKDDPGKYTQGAPLRTYRRLSVKTLKLNFWRPGDEYFENEREIRYGAPDFEAVDPDKVYYEWVYR